MGGMGGGPGMGGVGAWGPRNGEEWVGMEGVNLWFLPPLQAPSLLITLINMFLEFGQAPRITNNTATTEYSVFGPTAALADGQVTHTPYSTPYEFT